MESTTAQEKKSTNVSVSLPIPMLEKLLKKAGGRYGGVSQTVQDALELFFWLEEGDGRQPEKKAS